jgi:hypothetical protein
MVTRRRRRSLTIMTPRGSAWPIPHPPTAKVRTLPITTRAFLAEPAIFEQHFAYLEALAHEHPGVAHAIMKQTACLAERCSPLMASDRAGLR